MKDCPFEEIGCKFLHKKSKKCYYQENCKNKLCPFQHENILVSKNNVETDSENEINIVEIDEIQGDDNDYNKDILGQYYIEQQSENENETNNFKCDLCDAEFQRKGKLIKHFKTIHPDEDRAVYFMCEDCGYRGGDFDKYEFQNHKKQDDFEYCVKMKKHIKLEHDKESEYGKGFIFMIYCY